MERIKIKSKGVIKCSKSDAGESIEQKCRRITESNEPITDGAPMIYTERDDGVNPNSDIRTDRWEIAQQAMHLVNTSNIAKRKEAAKAKEVKTNKNDQTA